MKKVILTLIAVMAMTLQASAMSYEQARREALFLTDKMAYELNLSDAQYEAAYEINLDYLMGVTGRHDVFGAYWERRNADLNYILYSWQWDLYRAATYFFRPLCWEAGYWHFRVYARYPHRDYYYFGRPHFYASYRGGHSWHMNGGRSYYRHHHHDYRPHAHRDHHFGMRDGWNRGDYRSNDHGNSSTRITGRSSAGTHNHGITHQGNAGRSLTDGRERHTSPRSVAGASESRGSSYSLGRRSGISYSRSASAASDRGSSAASDRGSSAASERGSSVSYGRSSGISYGRSARASVSRSAGASLSRSNSFSSSTRSTSVGSRSAGMSRSSAGSPSSGMSRSSAGNHSGGSHIGGGRSGGRR